MSSVIQVSCFSAGLMTVRDHTPVTAVRETNGQRDQIAPNALMREGAMGNMMVLQACSLRESLR